MLGMTGLVWLDQLVLGKRGQLEIGGASLAEGGILKESLGQR